MWACAESVKLPKSRERRQRQSHFMASDPLSSTTHKARTYLLALSTAGFLSSWYNLKVRDIPFSGVDITVDEKLVPIMLTVGISYFLVSFVIYAVDDIINQAYTPYQERIRSTFTQLTDIVRDDALKSIEGTLTSTGTAAADAKATTAEIWARCFPLLKLDIDAFREQVTLILGNEFEIPPTEKSSLPPSMRTIEQVRKRSEDMSGYIGGEIFDSLELAWYGWTYHRKQIFNGKPRRYAWYRRIRVELFDLALPLLVGAVALIVMWRHLLPF